MTYSKFIPKQFYITEKHVTYVITTKLHPYFDITRQIALVRYEEGFNTRPSVSLYPSSQRTQAICRVILKQVCSFVYLCTILFFSPIFDSGFFKILSSEVLDHKNKIPVKSNFLWLMKSSVVGT